MKLQVQPLTAEAFAPFGQVIAQPAADPIASLVELDYWADVAILQDVGALSVGMAVLKICPLVQTAIERHMHTYELLLPVGGDMAVVCAPALYPDEPRRLPDASEFKAFRVTEGQAIAFGPAVWHYAPYALNGPMRVLLAYKAGTAQNDGIVVPLAGDQVIHLEP